MEHKYLDSYPLERGKKMRVYWITEEAHQPVEMEARRISDGAILYTVRKSYEEAKDILEVDSILKNAERCGKIPSAPKMADKKGV